MYNFYILAANIGFCMILETQMLQSWLFKKELNFRKQAVAVHHLHFQACQFGPQRFAWIPFGWSCCPVPVGSWICM